MKKPPCHTIAGCLGIMLLVSYASPEEKDNELLAEAAYLAQSAQEAEKTSYADAFTLYQEALAKAEMIATTYPSSQVAEKLARGEVQIGPYPLMELKATIVPQVQRKAEAEGGPLACAVLVARTIEGEQFRGFALEDIAGRYADAGQVDHALEVATTIEDDATKDRVLADIAGKYAAGGQYDHALEVAKTMKDIPALSRERTASKASTFAAIAAKYKAAGQKEQAMELLSQALQFAQAYPPEAAYIKGEALATIATQYMQADRKDKAAELFAQALEVAKTAEEDGLRGSALAPIAREYATAGQYAHALEIAKTVRNPSDVLAAIAGGCVAAGQYDHALETANLIASGTRDSALLGIVHAYVAGGQYDRALEIAKTVEYAPWRAFNLADIATKYAEAGQYDRALEIAKTAQDAPWNANVTALATIAAQYAAADQKEKAAELFVQALQFAATIEDTEKAQALAIIAAKYAEAGQKEEAAKLFSQALQLAETREDLSAKADMLMGIGFQYAKAGLKVDNSARKVLHAIIGGLDKQAGRVQPFKPFDDEGRRTVPERPSTAGVPYSVWEKYITSPLPTPPLSPADSHRP